DGPQHSANTMAAYPQLTYSGRLLPEQPSYMELVDSTPRPINKYTLTVSDFPIILENVKDALKNLPSKKAPGVDHIRQEMLSPITNKLVPTLLSPFELC
ncbi:uncharacterized protein BX663DRAFT_415222, partial [Cokeromyces recurvatus]|uniref:uncharacterized protein n=1 Tax=Cokeromyces recurvatus TaxID=90255 RepID=UPI002220B32B